MTRSRRGTRLKTDGLIIAMSAVLLARNRPARAGGGPLHGQEIAA